MSRLFGRHCEVTVGVPGQDGRSWSGLRVAVKATLTRGRSPSRAEVRIYNLSAESRAACEQRGARCIVRMGYDADRRDGLLPVLVRGDIVDVRHERERVDWVTTVKVADGERASRRARVSLAVENQPLADVLRQVAGSFSSLVPEESIEVRGFLDAAVSHPLFNTVIEQASLDGPATEVLAQLMPPGTSYTITDERLLLVAEDGTTGTEAIELSADTGAGVPKRRTRERGGRTVEDGVEVASLLAPRARPGQLVRLTSQLVAGDYVAREVQIEADTHDSRRWTTTFVLDAR